MTIKPPPKYKISPFRWERDLLVSTLRERQRTDSLLLALLSNPNAIPVSSLSTPAMSVSSVQAPACSLTKPSVKSTEKTVVQEKIVPSDKKKIKLSVSHKRVDKKKKDSHTCRRPDRDQYATEEEYKVAWQKWRTYRDKKNDIRRNDAKCIDK